jgi:3-hydroxyisobutyrate dehydrogenase
MKGVDMKSIGFIGLGVMGKPMALNLVKAGYDVLAYDINPAPVKDLVAAGGREAPSIKAVGQQQDTVVLMLRDSPQVEAVVCGEGGLLEVMKKGAKIVDMSTIDPVVTRKVAAVAAKKGVRMIDAPVSGGEPKAIAGTLTMIVGGEKDLVEECRPILETVGKTVFHVGDIGMGEAVKLANQLLVGVINVAVSEAFLFGTRLGADPKVLFDVISQSSGDSFLMRMNVPYPNIVPTSAANRDFAPGFMVDLMKKDLALILSAANNLKLPLLMSHVAHELFQATSAKGMGSKDMTAVSLLLRELAGEKK